MKSNPQDKSNDPCCPYPATSNVPMDERIRVQGSSGPSYVNADHTSDQPESVESEA
jgi:hypothetical protein